MWGPASAGLGLLVAPGLSFLTCQELGGLAKGMWLEFPGPPLSNSVILGQFLDPTRMDISFLEWG